MTDSLNIDTLDGTNRFKSDQRQGFLKAYDSIDEFSKDNKSSTVVTIGNFDGCHEDINY